MADIRIDSLPVADIQDPRDIFAIQRNVSGVWTDFQTDFDTFGGGLQMVTTTLDLSVFVGPELFLSPPVGSSVVAVAARVLYTPDPSPSLGSSSLQILDNPATQLLFVFDFNGSAASGALTPNGPGVCNYTQGDLYIDVFGGGANGIVKIEMDYMVIYP